VPAGLALKDAPTTVFVRLKGSSAHAPKVVIDESTMHQGPNDVLLLPSQLKLPKGWSVPMPSLTSGATFKPAVLVIVAEATK
jgi:hypothetical protein